MQTLVAVALASKQLDPGAVSNFIGKNANFHHWQGYFSPPI